jgi:hypothetical protein
MLRIESSTNNESFVKIGDQLCTRSRDPMEIPMILEAGTSKSRWADLWSYTPQFFIDKTELTTTLTQRWIPTIKY